MSTHGEAESLVYYKMMLLDIIAKKGNFQLLPELGDFMILSTARKMTDGIMYNVWPTAQL